jgi:hypothetical protein
MLPRPAGNRVGQDQEADAGQLVPLQAGADAPVRGDEASDPGGEQLMERVAGGRVAGPSGGGQPVDSRRQRRSQRVVVGAGGAMSDHESLPGRRRT